MTVNFHNTHFEISASKVAECPGASVPEIVFAGRSNAGKSTAINVLCKQRQLAYASRTPGRTQLLNFFTVLEKGETIARLVDLPGYGFAQLSQTSQSAWDRELGTFLADRISLRGCVLIVDSRRGLQDLDHALVRWVKKRQLPIHIVLSKADKLNRQGQINCLRQAKADIAQYGAQVELITVQLWSSLSKLGLSDLEQQLNQWIRPVEPEQIVAEQPTESPPTNKEN